MKAAEDVDKKMDLVHVSDAQLDEMLLYRFMIKEKK